MRKVRYVVAMSLDGFIAGPNGEADWITMDPEIDFAALFHQFDTILLGRRTFEGMMKSGRAIIPGMKTFVFSRTLLSTDCTKMIIVSNNPLEAVGALKRAPGKDIWLFGGSLLFRSLAKGKLVDTVEVTVMPILLGAGIPLLPPDSGRIPLSPVGQGVQNWSGHSRIPDRQPLTRLLLKTA